RLALRLGAPGRRRGGVAMTVATETPLSALDHARALTARGFATIPVPHKSKRPVLKGWERLRLGDADLPRYFNGRAQNIGVLLGEPSGGIIDIDLDHYEAVKAAGQILPATGMIWGRAGKPRSHYIYKVTRPVKTRK